MDRQKTKLIAADAEAALQAVAVKHGLVVKYRKGTYGDTNVTLQFEFAEVNKDGVVEDRAASDFKQLAELYGLKATDLGRQFTYAGNIYTITGMKPASRKAPIIAKRADGKSFKLPADLVVAMLAKAGG